MFLTATLSPQPPPPFVHYSLFRSCAGIGGSAVLYIPVDVARSCPSDGHGTRRGLCDGHDHLVRVVVPVRMGLLQDSYHYALGHFLGVRKHVVHCCLARPGYLGLLPTRQVDTWIDVSVSFFYIPLCTRRSVHRVFSLQVRSNRQLRHGPRKMYDTR